MTGRVGGDLLEQDDLDRAEALIQPETMAWRHFRLSRPPRGSTSVQAREAKISLELTYRGTPGSAAFSPPVVA